MKQKYKYFAVGSFLSVAIIKPDIIADLFSIYDYAPFKCLVAFGIAYQGKNVVKYSKAMIKGIKTKLNNMYYCNAEMYEGIRIPKLVSYLVDNKTFRQNNVKRFFGLSHHKAVKLSKDLEKRGVLVRGEYNAFKLANISREEIVRLLSPQKKKYTIKYWNTPKIDFHVNRKCLH